MKRNSNRSTPKTSAPAPAATPVADNPNVHAVKDPAKLDDILNAVPAPSPTAKAPAAAPQPASNSSTPKRHVAFQLQRPARSVKVAGDFTHWDQAPLEMTAAGEGQWSAIVQLPPGEYAYRFIVDDQWCEDPLCSQHVPNGFGSQNSVIIVR